jgi:hypothetical protein
MRRLITFLITLASIAFGVCSPLQAQMISPVQFMVLGCQGNCGGGGSPVTIFTHTFTNTNRETKTHQRASPFRLQERASDT